MIPTEALIFKSCERYQVDILEEAIIVCETGHFSSVVARIINSSVHSQVYWTLGFMVFDTLQVVLESKIVFSSPIHVQSHYKVFEFIRLIALKVGDFLSKET